MAVGDHRYVDPRWSHILSDVLHLPHRRVKLYEDPEKSADHWGFCEGGMAFLKLVNALDKTFGEETVQYYTDQCISYYKKHPQEVLVLAGTLSKLMASKQTIGFLTQMAKGLGYSK